MLRAFARALRNEVPAEYVFGLSGAMGRPVRVPEQVYAEQRAASLAAAAARSATRLARVNLAAAGGELDAAAAGDAASAAAAEAADSAWLGALAAQE